MTLKKYTEIPIGGVITEAGNSLNYHTGSWRTFRPILDKQKCINCMFCWMYCPDMSVIVENEEMKGFKYEYCKGCGVCAEVCPTKAITMEKEHRKED